MKKITLVLFASICLLGLSACASTANSESTGQYFDSTAVTTKVKASLANTIGLKSLKAIDVTTYKGVVQLSGFVTNQKEIDEAVAVVKKVAGVKSVENSLLVKKDMK